MRRTDLARLVLISGALGRGADILVVGSQAILGTVAEAELPSEATTSIEADITFLDGDEQKSDLVDAMLGEDSEFHLAYGLYAQGVGVTTATLPGGWH